MLYKVKPDVWEFPTERQSSTHNSWTRTATGTYTFFLKTNCITHILQIIHWAPQVFINCCLCRNKDTVKWCDVMWCDIKIIICDDVSQKRILIMKTVAGDYHHWFDHPLCPPSDFDVEIQSKYKSQLNTTKYQPKYRQTCLPSCIFWLSLSSNIKNTQVDTPNSQTS